MAHRKTRKRSVSKRKPRSRFTRRSRMYHQKAGGSWQSFCVACGKPLSNMYLGEEPFNKPNAETNWMNYSYGYESTHPFVFELGEDDSYGAAEIRGFINADQEMEDMFHDMFPEIDVDAGNLFHIQNFDSIDAEPEDAPFGGMVIHRHCHKQLTRSGIDVSLELLQKLNAHCRVNKQYQEQEYNWEAALAANPNHHKSPLKSASSKHELLFGCGRDVPEMMESNDVREEMARRRRVVDTKRFTNLSRNINLPVNIKKQIGTYLNLAKPENIKAGNKVVPGNIAEFNEAAAAAAAGAASAPAALENVD